MQINSSTSNNSVQHKHAVLMYVQFNWEKTFIVQAIHFSQAVLIQLIHFSVSTDFVYTQLNVKNQFHFK